MTMLRILSFLCIYQISNSFLNPPFYVSVKTNGNDKEGKSGPIFAGGGFGGEKSTTKQGKKGKNQSPSSIKKKLQMKEKLLKEYGGDIAKGTEQRIQDAMSALPKEIQEIAELYRKVKRWDASMASLSLMQKKQVPHRDIEGAKRARAELGAFYENYDITEQYMHNLFQRITWNASADAKAVNASIGQMPSHILKRVNRACESIADSVKRAGRKDGRCLDVGCGHGTLIPSLTNVGIYPSQITGVDLSPEMIRNAKKRFRGPTFIATDFLQFDNKDEYDGIIFCSSLHDLPNMKSSISKAAELLRPEGKLVIVHAQGGEHVNLQHKANPVLVSRGLPAEDELLHWAEELMLELEVSPAAPSSEEDKKEGYLAILRKKAL